MLVPDKDQAVCHTLFTAMKAVLFTVLLRFSSDKVRIVPLTVTVMK